MTNSTNKMIGKNIERRNPVQSRSERKARNSPKVQTSHVYVNSLATPTRAAKHHQPATPPDRDMERVLRLSPSTRTSPGLLLGHFAGGKWTEPPSPAELPKPPQQWMQLMCRGASKQGVEVAKHLKVLLNMQA